MEPSVGLASRVQKIAPFHVMEVPPAARALEAAGRSLVPVAIGEPAFRSSPRVLAAAQRALTHGHIQYTCAPGMASLHSPAFCRHALQGACTAITPGIDFWGHRADKQVRFAYLIGQEQLEKGVARRRSRPPCNVVQP